jgi:hypothetical protein
MEKGAAIGFREAAGIIAGRRATVVPKLVQPGKCAFNDPPPPTQATSMLRAAHGKQWENVASSQHLTDGLRVIRTVAEHAVRPAPWSPSLTLEWRNRIDKGQRFFRVVPVGGTRQADGERHAPSVADHVTLAASLGSIRRIRAVCCPPHTARTEQLSMTARDQ